jgi:predicted dehydrogenase
LADRPIRVAVVGLGAFGRHHARHLAANPAADLVALVDVDRATADAAAAQHGCDAFADPYTLVGKVDAVAIATPATTHAAITGAFLDAGVHVLVEKPLATTGADARDLVARAAKAHVVLQPGHIERFSPSVQALAARVSDPRRMSFSRRTPWTGRCGDVDVILDLMIHDIDIALALAASPVASVAGEGTVGPSGAVDEAEAWLTFANGVVATLSASRTAERSERRIVVTEPGAVYSADLSGPSLTVAARSRWGAEASPIALQPRDNLAAEIDAFITSVRTGTPPVVDGAAGLAAVEIAERIAVAIADGASAKRSAAL